MQHPHRFRFKSSRSSGGQDGYILLTLLFFAAVLAITAMAVLPRVAHEIQRDREEELVHRGAQYARALRRYYKKFGRFPTRIEELETSNNLRFLRQRYKDPITGEDFRLLHLGEVKLGLPRSGAGPAPGLPGALGQSPLGAAAAAAGALAAQAGGLGGTAGTGLGPGNSPFGTPGVGGTSGSRGGPVFGGGPIVGVVSTSDKTSIREYSGKAKYSDWQFIFDPALDRGGLLNAPSQPPLQGAVPVGGTPGAPGTPGVPGTTPPPATPEPGPQSPNSPQ